MGGSELFYGGLGKGVGLDGFGRVVLLIDCLHRLVGGAITQD